ncbi:hypothetical protein AB3S75_003640 [Citrus x aurantiifolia]
MIGPRLDFYTRTGRIDLANKIFDRLPVKDSASWITLILGYGMLGELDVAINLFESMREDGVEYDPVSHIAVLTACSLGGLVERGRSSSMKCKLATLSQQKRTMLVWLIS